MASTIHNIAVAGHGTCGKTTLVEELLVRGGTLKRAGKVDDGSSVLDSEADEKERQFTIEPSICSLSAQGRTLQLIDTPGYPDFVGSVIDAFSVVETCLIAIDASQGIRVNTRRVWDEAGKAGIARMIIITRIDSDQARFDELLEEIRESFGRACVPLFIPDQAGPGVSEIENTYLTDDSSSDRAKKLHKTVLEAVVEFNEDLMEKYLAEEPITQDELDHVFSDAILAGAVVPVMCVSVHKNVGVQKTLDTLITLTPESDAPIHRQMRNADGEDVEGSPHGSESDPLLARVFKVMADPFVGKLSFVRVFSGQLTTNAHIMNANCGSKERATALVQTQGKDHKNVDKAGPGEIVAIPKLETAEIGHNLIDPGRKTWLRSVPHPVPMVKLAIEPENRNDETKLSAALKKLAESDSTFTAARNAQTHELVIAGRSTLHLDVILGRLKDRYDLKVTTHVPKTSYLESINGKSESHHKHKKQSGGRGQFGEVYLKLEPIQCESDEYLEFNNAIVGGVIPQQFIPAVEKGIRECMVSGILAGCPVMNCKVTLYDGSFHTVDSSEAAFKTAGREAFKKAFHDAKPCLLEPIVNIEIHIPTQFMGDITGDLNSRRGRIQGMDTVGDTQVIQAQVPEAEIKVYSTELRSLTAGEGSYSVEFSHYDAVPSNVQSQILDQMKKEAAESA